MRLLIYSLLFSGLACAQAPKIGVIDFYGLRKIPETRIRKALGFAEGADLPPSKGDVETRIENVPDIVAAQLEATCCDEHGKAILYVGVEEKGAPHFEYRTPPGGNAELPAEVVPTYAKFLNAVMDAGRRGETAEDLTRGHSFMADPKARSLQLQFEDYAAKYENELRNVLRNSQSEEQRAMAAYIIGYAAKKAKVVDDLQYALQDPDAGVRNNATRSLAAFAVFARKNSGADIKISPTWFVEMLNSLAWGDRNNAAVTLVTLTDDRDEKVLSQVKDRALRSLIEMAGWKHLPHALPAYILVGRVLGMKEEDLQAAWSKDQRSVVIGRARALLK